MAGHGSGFAADRRKLRKAARQQERTTKRHMSRNEKKAKRVYAWSPFWGHGSVHASWAMDALMGNGRTSTGSSPAGTGAARLPHDLLSIATKMVSAP